VTSSASFEGTKKTGYLPRLAVITDVPVERTQSGQLLLYRLLAGYPPDRILVVQSQHYPSAGREFQLSGVEYRRLDYPIPRIINNKFNPLWPLMTWAGMRLYHKSAERIVRDFGPEAVITVSHTFLWFAAAAAARRLGLPLYLILHDHWPSMMTGNRKGPLWRGLRSVYQQILGRVYRQTVERFCVSPGMAELCEATFGIRGKVLYPNRGEDSPVPKVRVGQAHVSGGPVVAFAGALYTSGVPELLRSMTKILAELGGHLDLYMKMPPERLPEFGLTPPTVRIVGFFPSAALAERIADTAHALLLPASFRPEERTSVSTLFPSKLADYTAIGMPIIIWGPSYSSAARWGLVNPAAAVTYTAPDPTPVRALLLRIVKEPGCAQALARAAVETGSRYFDLNHNRTVLFDSLRRAIAPCELRLANIVSRPKQCLPCEPH
jgi:glycosyltransferase involved in cell wall biosynthesis